MGYTTYFSGELVIEPALKPEHATYLDKFENMVHQDVDPEKLQDLPDALRIAAGLPIGEHGEFFIGDDGVPQDALLSHNHNPGTPGYWCNWAVSGHWRVPDDDSQSMLAWNDGEKFYNYVEWLQFYLDRFLTPWGYQVNGQIDWNGEESDDFGYMSVEDNELTVYDGIQDYVKRVA